MRAEARNLILSLLAPKIIEEFHRRRAVARVVVLAYANIFGLASQPGQSTIMYLFAALLCLLLVCFFERLERPRRTSMRRPVEFPSFLPGPVPGLLLCFVHISTLLRSSCIEYADSYVVTALSESGSQYASIDKKFCTIPVCRLSHISVRQVLMHCVFAFTSLRQNRRLRWFLDLLFQHR